MLDGQFPAGTGAHERDRRGEDTFPALTSLDCSRDETASVTYTFDVIENGDLAVAGEHEVAVHAVDGVEVTGDGELGGGQALGDGGAAEDAAGTGRVPEWSGVGEDVRSDV